MEEYPRNMPSYIMESKFPTLEEISIQNGPPKENNKIIFINFGGRKEKTIFYSYF